MYDSIQTISIKNYIYFLKYINLISCLYVDHDFYISIFTATGSKEKIEAQSQNKANFQQLQKNNIDLYQYAYLCLQKNTESFTETYLDSIIKKKKREDVSTTVNEMSKRFNDEVLEKGLQDGYYQDGIWYSRESVLTTKSLYSQLISAITSGYDLVKYSQAIDSIYTPQLASNVDRFFEKDFNKNLMLLEKDGYKIKTAFDYYTAIDIVSSQKQANNS